MSYTEVFGSSVDVGGEEVEQLEQAATEAEEVVSPEKTKAEEVVSPEKTKPVLPTSRRPKPIKKRSQPRKYVPEKSEKSRERYKFEDKTSDALARIADTIERGHIDTDNLFSEDLTNNPLTKKIINHSDVIDTSWKEIIKANAIINPSHYIAGRARLIKGTNNKIAEQLIQYDSHLETLNLPYSKRKALLQRKLIGLVDDHYTEVNLKYPINNLAASLQNAISTAHLRQP